MTAICLRSPAFDVFPTKARKKLHLAGFVENRHVFLGKSTQEGDDI